MRTNAWISTVVLLVAFACVSSVAAGATGATGATGTTAAQDGGEPTPIEECTTITEPGTYVLVGDLSAPDDESCIQIEADDVILDGDGHAIDGGSTGQTTEEFVQQVFEGEPSPDDERWIRAGVVADGISNVTVRNLEASGWLAGVSLVDVNEGSVENVTASENGFGVVLAGGEGGSVADANASSNAGAGVLLLETREASVSGVEAKENGLFGVYALTTRRTTVTNATASRNDVAGILHEGGADAIVRDVRTQSNTVAGVYLVGSTDATVVDASAPENRQVGVYVLDAERATVRGGDANGNAVGVVLENASDVTVGAVEATLNRQAGVAVTATTDARVERVVASGNDFAGVYVVESDDVAVRNVNGTDNGIGVVFENATDGTVQGGIFAANARTGVTLFETTDVVVSGVEAGENDYHGVFVANASGNAVVESNASYNGLTGVYLRNASENAITDNTLLANGLAGVFEEDAIGNRLADNEDGTIPFEPTDDELGREGGIAHGDEIQIDQDDGLNETELRQYVYRAIARAEYIRGLEYEETVDVEVITRSENRRRTMGQPTDPGPTGAWRDQVWEAAFVIGEDENASEELQEFRGERVLGYYLPPANKLVIVTDDEGGGVDSVTLVHEIVHALQDQHLGLVESAERARTEDAQRARDGLVEGDATYVEEQFELLCGSIWNCVATNSTSPRSAEIPEVNLGVSRVIGQPYSDGPAFVDSRYEEGGWDAVNDAYDDPPNATEQVIHPGKADEEPVPIEVENEPTDGWTRFDGPDLQAGENGTTTFGEAGIYTTFWYQSVEYDIPIVDVDSHFVPEGGAFDRLNYTSQPSEGWGNDVLVPYRNGEEGAYVWVTEWDTEQDAREFHRAYLTMLQGHDATREAPQVWVIPDGPFEDAFHVERNGTRVTITNAPRVGDLEDVRPGIEIGEGLDGDGSGGGESGGDGADGLNASSASNSMAIRNNSVQAII